LRKCFWVFDKLFAEYLPNLYKHFKKEGVDLALFATPWFLTIFTSVLPLNVAVKVWDLFLLRGWVAIYRISLSLLTLLEKEFLEGDFEGIFFIFQNLSQHFSDGSLLLKTALSLRVTSSQVEKLVIRFSETQK